MRINPINFVTSIKNINKNQSKQQAKKQSFGTGLPKDTVNFLRGLTSENIKELKEELLDVYGIQTDEQNKEKVPVWCAFATAKMMKRAGFLLPRRFEFKPLDSDEVLGQYDLVFDTISINSKFKQFLDISEQNTLEEKQDNFHPYTRHFMHTYTHEFSHAAHIKHIYKMYGYEQGNRIIDKMQEIKPCDYIIAPINTILKSITPKFADKIINKHFPITEGLYAKGNLMEYFAEMNARKMAEYLIRKETILGIPENFADKYAKIKYKGFKDILSNKLLDIWLTDRDSVPIKIINTVLTCKEDIETTDANIYNGCLCCYEPYYKMK